MATNIFDKYGIKEVANVSFVALESDTNLGVSAGDVVLYLDTLKVSTIETTAEQSDATGGWGNPKLITWDYGKEVTITLEDALISMESLAFMYGGAINDSTASNTTVTIRRSAEGTVASTSGSIFAELYDGASKVKLSTAGLGTVHGTTSNVHFINFTKGTRATIDLTDTSAPCTLAELNTAILNSISTLGWTADDRVRVFWDEDRTGAASSSNPTAVEVTISANTFPGTYKVVGDTFIRSQDTGADSAYQFVINKAKVSSEITLTLEAEGDPSTFEMTLTALRDDDQNLFSLIKY